MELQVTGAMLGVGLGCWMACIARDSLGEASDEASISACRSARLLGLLIAFVVTPCAVGLSLAA